MVAIAYAGRRLWPARALAGAGRYPNKAGLAERASGLPIRTRLGHRTVVFALDLGNA
jgi:hypothetical protein